MADRTMYFLAGPLSDPGLLHSVTGDRPRLRPGRLDGFGTAGPDEESGGPVCLRRADGSVGGVLAELTGDAAQRLATYVALFGAEFRELRVGGEAALAPLNEEAPLRSHDATSWARRLGPIAPLAAEEALAALAAGVPADVVSGRYAKLMVRAQARANARNGTPPATTRRARSQGDLVIEGWRQPYANFFAVEEYDIDHVRFDGTRSGRLERAVFVSGDAVTVLPYDPARDRVLLVEQIRLGPLGRGDPNPWTLEPIAGRLDGGETPGTTARREAEEEAGLALTELIPCGRYYPSPGAKSEFVYSYIGLADLPDGAGGLGGAAEEAEDIRAHVLSFDRLMSLIESGEAQTGPLIISALRLAALRPLLRS
ncbi:NUDIX domain-containing protein [Tropicimonas sp. IMCC34011]|uniref:NUDIX domain-containing protein n=1 Tax=Tropicimonas sp. IMCC34011 TaxID=2248759 RepID=UPI001300655B|nr:NUDIX domain-containing protein [Tropicimonas sp. IMCC34011]